MQLHSALSFEIAISKESAEIYTVVANYACW